MAKLDRQKMALVAVSAALLICAVYIALSELQKIKDAEQLSAYNQGVQYGAQYGYQQAVVQLMQQAATCQQVPVTFDNRTISIIAVACLQQAEG